MQTLSYDQTSPELIPDSIPFGPDDPPVFESTRAPVALALFSRDLKNKALRHDDCGCLMVSDHCERGHVRHRVNFCGLAICLRCATDRAKARVKELLPYISAVTRLFPQLQLTYLEFKIPCANSPDAIRVIREQLTRTYLRLIDRLDAYDAKEEVDTILLTNVAGFTEDGKLVIRLLNIHAIHPCDSIHADIKLQFPQSRPRDIVVSTCAVSQAPKFLEFLFKPSIPTAPDRVADMELAMSYLRRFVSIGHIPIQDSPEMIVTDTPALTNNSGDTPPSDGQESPPKQRLCKICKAPIVRTEVERLSDQFHPNRKPPN